ncbi:MAG: chromosomal replication initiator protein DnaA [Deltaproteobacteria bacterium]|nr:chromosomal replication initiator protein DnaA [Deltaproteobacteria bacterium]MBW2352380.1 chromosomal replication initiator protein DnaA [Deltaproteobacteria bacterium]
MALRDRRVRSLIIHPTRLKITHNPEQNLNSYTSYTVRIFIDVLVTILYTNPISYKPLTVWQPYGMSEKNNIWDRIKGSFRADMPESEFDTWLSRVSLKKLDRDIAVIEVPNKFVARWLNDNYRDRIQTAFRKGFNTTPQVSFIFPTPSREGGVGEKLSSIDPHPNYAKVLNPLNTFSSFITDNSNRLAYSSALEIAERRSNNYNPLYIFSKLSLGKTHLLHAIGNMAVKNDPSANVIYLSTRSLVKALSAPHIKTDNDYLWERYGDPDLLLTDDLHLMAGHKRPQEEFLALCKSVLESNGQLAVAASYPPSKIPHLLPELRSRLEWGLITEIQNPTLKTKTRIIRKSASLKGLSLSDNVVFFLASTTDNLKDLHGYMEELEGYSSSHRARVDISVVDSIIRKKSLRSDNIDLRQIQKATAEHFNIPLTDLLSDKREKTFSYPRQIAIYLSRKLTTLSLKEIGSSFGNRHHSTVIYTIKRIGRIRQHNNDIANDINMIQTDLIRNKGVEFYR